MPLYSIPNIKQDVQRTSNFLQYLGTFRYLFTSNSWLVQRVSPSFDLCRCAIMVDGVLANGAPVDGVRVAGHVPRSASRLAAML